jgi:cytochrome c oxidase subunit II
MGLLLALAIAGITVISTYFFAAKTWWLPPYISEYGYAYDKHFMLTMTICGIIFVAAQLALAYTVFRYRRHNGPVTYSHGNNTLEVIWTSAAAVLFLGLVIAGTHIWTQAHLEAAPVGAIPIEVWGQQFTWYVRYPGPDGQFGRTKPELMKESTGHPLGIDPDDPAGKDDFVMPTITIPVNRPVEIRLHSKDVIHSFYVRELRLKQDAVPGLDISIHFTASKIGRYEMPCAELCGLGHYQMRTFLDVKSEEDYEKFLAENATPAQ